VSQSGSSERTLRIYFYTFFEDLRGSLTDLSVIVGIIAFYQFAILRSVPDDLPDIVVGLMLVAVGLALFLRGLELGIFPLGEDLSQRLATLNTRAWILLFALRHRFCHHGRRTRADCNRSQGGSDQ
jgi:hypothetical protein